MSAADLARALAERAEDVCRYLLPNGRRVGHEWKVGSVDGEAGDSLGVRLTSEKAGLWADFGGDESGDLIGLWKAVRRVDVATACREAEDWLGIPRRNGSERRPIMRAVAPDAEPSHVHPRLGAPTGTWAYRDAQGRVLGYVCRFDPAGERKQVLPQTWDGSAWAWRGFDEPRPLYGLERLAARPDAPVLVVEGEKCADAAAALLSGMVAVSWPGGCKAVDKVDFEPLRGRLVTFWPDADEPGKDAMERIAARLEQACRIVRPSGFDAGWDIADAAADGWDAARVAEWAKAHVEHWFPPPAQPAPLEEPHARVSDSAPTEAMLEERPTPIDLFERAPLPELAAAMLPPAIAPFIFDQSEIIGSDPCILALAALTACAAVTSDAIKIQPKQHEFGWRESARLWGAFVGDPSVKKTPPLNRATSHLRKLDADFADAGAEAMHRYKIARKVYEKAEARWIDDQSKNKPCGPLQDPPEKPRVRRIIVQDATIEAVSDILADNPEGVMVLFDELSGFFGSMDAYRSNGGKDRSFWLESYNGGPRRVDRVSREAMSVPNLSTCILGGIQPSAIRAQAAKSYEDGLLQRFMIVVAQGGDAVGKDRRADTGASTLYRGILDHLVAQQPQGDEPVTLDDEARRVMFHVEQQLAAFQALDSLPTRMRYQLGKWSGLFARLCLTYHAIECAALGLPVAGQVAGDIAERVRRFMFEFLFWHLQYFYETVIGDVTGRAELAQRIADWIIAKGIDRFSESALSQGVKAWRNTAWVDRRAVLDTLDVCGWIERVRKTEVGGRTMWEVNPSVHEMFAGRADAERERRERLRKAFLNEP